MGVFLRSSQELLVKSAGSSGVTDGVFPHSVQACNRTVKQTKGKVKDIVIPFSAINMPSPDPPLPSRCGTCNATSVDGASQFQSCRVGIPCPRGTHDATSMGGAPQFQSTSEHNRAQRKKASHHRWAAFSEKFTCFFGSSATWYFL